jgi:hypothetical protein
MSNDNASRSGRTNGAAPMGSTVAIVVTAIAVILAFLILRKVNEGSTDTSSSKPNNTSAQSTTTLDGSQVTTGSTEAPTTTAPLITTGTKVQVANASTQNGVAKQMSDVLGTKGFSMAEAVSASVKLSVSKVYYKADDPAALDVANSLASLFGGIAVEPSGLPVPAGEGAWAEGSGVILMLGDDFAGKTLAQISGAPTTGTTTPPTTAAAGVTTTT